MHLLSWIRIACHVIFLAACSTGHGITRSVDYEHKGTDIAPAPEDEIQSVELIKRIPFLGDSIPFKIYECLKVHSMMRCMKIYVLQRMEDHKLNRRTNNLTRDFIEQFFANQDKDKSSSGPFPKEYTQLSDSALTKRLVQNFQQFFKNRDIKLHFLPGIMVRIVPSKDNKLKFSFKKKLKIAEAETFSGRSQRTSDESDDQIPGLDPSTSIADGVSGEVKNPAIGTVKKRKNKKHNSYKNTILQFAVPIMIMPAILLGSILPFILPVLKMATIMSLLLNNTAFMAALLYAARTHANVQEEQHISYGSHPPYH